VIAAAAPVPVHVVAPAGEAAGASATTLAERLLTPELMADLAQMIVLEALEQLAGDARFAAAAKLGGDERARAAVDRFAERQLEREAAFIAADRPALVVVIARRYQQDFSEVERRRILAFRATPAGKTFVKGDPASSRPPEVAAFLASNTGRRYAEHGAALLEGRDVAGWREHATARLRSRLAPGIATLATELDLIARTPS